MGQKDPLFPRSRSEVFFDLWKHHKLELVKTNLWCLLFLAPSIVLVYLYSLFNGLLPSLVSNGQWTLPTIDGTAISVSLYLFQIRNVLCAILLVTNTLAFLGLGGFYRVVQKMVFMDTVDIKDDFFSGVKSNAKQSVFLSFFFSLFIFFVQFVVSYYWNDLSNWVSIASIVIAIIVLFFLLLLVAIAFPFLNLYKAGLWTTLKDSLVLLFSSFFKSFLYILLAYLPLALFLVPNIIVTSVAELLFIFLYFPYFTVITTLNGNAVFDKEINGERFPELVDKGIKK